MLSTSIVMINIGCHTSSKWAKKFGYICRRSTSMGPTTSFAHSNMGLTITKVARDNFFDLSIAPFIGMHPVFNVDCLGPYFPPLLDTLEIVEQRIPTDLNQNCMEQATTNQIMDTQIKNTRQ